MNVASIRRRAGKRGVSPIIATILLVAITVVLAAVLYVLISGLTSSSGSTPYSLQMSGPIQSTPAAGTFWITMQINPTSGLTTALFGLKVTALNGTATAGVAPPGTCVATAAFTVANCPKGTAGTTAWYVVIESSAGIVLNTWQLVGGVGAWGASTSTVSSSMTMIVVSGATLDGIGSHMVAYNLGASSVSGQVLL